ncbi:MAG: nucleotidyltransferase domain-containing protein [Anaerolineae bacterium]|nr:nucleotidyltransferase domain-containing protein [Anaerolineae bacterium]MCI0607906.1 nucleotidyltransferase domain-containing protein [Anaerolineae bacterium]
MEKISKRAISSFAQKVAKQFNPHKIILFGSYAYGKPTADSDVDILVVMPFKGRNPKKATEIWMATQPKFPVDIIVRKPSELKKRLRLGDFFLREITQKGKVLYQNTDAKKVEKRNSLGKS